MLGDTILLTDELNFHFLSFIFLDGLTQKTYFFFWLFLSEVAIKSGHSMAIIPSNNKKQLRKNLHKEL